MFQAESFRVDSYLTKLGLLEDFLALLVSRSESEKVSPIGCEEETDVNDNICCICYTSEANARFVPCSHMSCYGCITRHMLNCHRCFFCNATVLEVSRIDEKTY